MEVDVGGFLTQNTTYDYPDDYQYVEDVNPTGVQVLPVSIAVLYSAVLLVGLPGNVLLLSVLAQKRQHWRISDIFILNLAISDVLLLVTLPFWAVQAAHQSGWCFGTAMCKICGAVFNMNFYCGILLLVCISLYHYLSIVHSVLLYSHKKPMLVHASCVAVWMVSLLLTIPDWIYLEAGEQATQKKTLCFHTYTRSAADWQLWQRLLHHIVGFLLPLATLIFCCSGVLLRLHCSFKDLKQQRAVTILPLLGVFFVCWTPYNVTLIVDTCNGSKDSQRRSSVLTAMFAVGCVHACLRPVIYALLCGNFKKRMLAVLRCEAIVDSKGEVKSSLWDLGVGQEALPSQSHELERLKQTTCVQSMDSHAT